MEFTFARCKTITETLPIGFYTGRRVEITVSETEPTSYYSPTDDKIVVSYPIIAHRMAQIAENSCNEEEAVRSMLYHEVSHAILTPVKEFYNNKELNCFEDERIESVLRHYYHGVDFRKQLLDIHGGHVPEAKNASQAFFNAVRFGLGTAAVQERIRQMLNKYAKLNRASLRYTGSPTIAQYENDVYYLYKLITKEFRTEPEKFSPPKSSTTNTNEQPNDQTQDTSSDDVDAIPYKGIPHEVAMSDEEIKKLVGACISHKANLDAADCEKLDEFQRKAEMIINNFRKKNAGGNGITAYSGVFNPRAVARKDYRYFDRSISTNGNNKYGSCHLNLIIDCSGSFAPNVPLTNGILAILTEIERKNRNFSMDVAFINHEFHLCNSIKERQMYASGGNTIPDNMKEILVQLQKPQTCNYNIVLFDGDAICQDYYGKDCNKLFGVFDMKQTTLITDPDNKTYMDPPFSLAKVVITDNYTEQLIDNIIKALTIAFG